MHKYEKQIQQHEKKLPLPHFHNYRQPTASCIKYLCMLPMCRLLHSSRDQQLYLPAVMFRTRSVDAKIVSIITQTQNEGKDGKQQSTQREGVLPCTTLYLALLCTILHHLVPCTTVYDLALPCTLHCCVQPCTTLYLALHCSLHCCVLPYTTLYLALPCTFECCATLHHLVPCTTVHYLETCTTVHYLAPP